MRSRCGERGEKSASIIAEECIAKVGELFQANKIVDYDENLNCAIAFHQNLKHFAKLGEYASQILDHGLEYALSRDQQRLEAPHG